MTPADSHKQASAPNLCDSVDPFIGSAAYDLPEATGIAGRWWTPKPPIGNTHPGATLPFGMVSACAYSGGYVTGYGKYDLSLDGNTPPVLHPDHRAYGIAHFQQSGTGRIRVYYNYLLTTPLTGSSLESRHDPQTLIEEKASPGVYSGLFEQSGVHFKVTTTARSVRHQYRFPDGAKPHVAIDASAGGLLIDGMQSYPQGGSLRIDAPDRVSGTIHMEGVPIHFSCQCPGARASLWQDDQLLEGESEYQLGLDKQKFQPAFGFVFSAVEEGCPLMELTFSFSLQDPKRTENLCEELRERSTESIVADAQQQWQDTLGKIEISGGTESQRQTFYTALYHSCIKPADFKNENPFRHQPGPFFFDLSTLWDLYKTQLPLMMTLWPERGSDFSQFLTEVATREGGFPVSYLMDSSPDRFTKQATGLCHMILEDARLRNIDADWNLILKLLWKTSRSGKGRQSKFGDYARNEVVSPLSHTLDISYAHFCLARMARGLGDQVIHDSAAQLSLHWKNALDPESGLLKEDSTYYEGENWNYSFRFIHDMEGRIKLAGGVERYTELLDLFFGFRYPSPGQRVFHFEGLNNEPDMEAPYSYLYVGKHDRMAEIVQAVMRSKFGTGRGGLPGNDDSGGLSSWFVWSACGIFPVTGQPVMLIGSPLFEKATLHLPGGDFTIESPGASAEKPFISTATLNGKPLERAWLNISEFQSGGHLVLHRTSTPSGFGQHHLPPSFTP
ncbi:hypothetical protein NT6N_21290 [Oceaniferula spumae]|uniref:Glycoside hydrolase family 92 protein n=1 Tax=Oceaniferula spumae TaxID=2979115 RepID=A0AAT9FM55_9BACT